VARGVDMAYLRLTGLVWSEHGTVIRLTHAADAALPKLLWDFLFTFCLSLTFNIYEG